MDTRYDVIIIGGGLSGATLGLALAAGDMRVCVIDRTMPDTQLAPEFDGRATAIASSSQQMFEVLGVWDKMAEVEPMLDILVTDGRLDEPPSPRFLHFDHQEAGDGNSPFGYMVENRHLRAALLGAMKDMEKITLLAPAEVAHTRRNDYRVEVELEDGQLLHAPLIVACDGRNSRTAAEARIKKIAWSYPQTGIVATVKTEKPHQGVAHEYFLPSGPFAILPLPRDRCSLVWTERPDIAHTALALDNAGFLAEIKRRFGDFLGPLSLEGPRFAYPLSFHLAREYVRPRLALVGDAAHGVHPIAGQGFNLGVRDCAALAEVLTDALRLGEDIGALAVLERYQKWRRFDNTLMGLSFDAMNRLFSNDFGPLRAVRDLGLGLMNGIAPARRFFAAQAAGAAGERPKLLRGEAL